jgi:hypothetical protein
MVIDFFRLSRDQFERLCRQVICAEYPGAKPVEGKSGDEGIDAMRGVIDEHLDTVWQFKHFCSGIGKSQKGQIRGSLNRVVPQKPDQWVCVLSCDLDTNGHRYFAKLNREFKAKHGIEVVSMPGTELQNLLVKHQWIRDEYFPTIDLELRTLSGLIASMHPELARPKASVVKQLADGIDYVNAHSPDVKYSFVATEGALNIFAEPRLGTDVEMFRVKLRMPEGAAGEHVRRQLNDWTKKGYPVTLERDFFEVEESVFDIFLGEDESFHKLEIIPQVPLISLPLRLEARQADGKVAASLFLDLKLARRGSDEAEFTNAAQDLPVDVSLAMSRTGKADIHFSYRPWGKRPQAVKRVNDFFACAIEADEVWAEALADGKEFGLLTLKPGDFVLERGWTRLVDDLVFIEDRLHTAFALPEHMPDAELQALKRLVRLLKNGYEDLNFSEGELTLEPEANLLLDFNKLKKDRAMMRFGGETEDEMLAMLGSEFQLIHGRLELTGELVEAERLDDSPDSRLKLTVKGISAQRFFDVSLVTA